MCAMRNEGADDVERAHALLVMGRAADAVPCLLDAVAQDPGDPRASSLLAVAYLELGLNDEALEAAGRAAAVDPVQEFPHRLRATALLRLSRKPEALAAAPESLRLAPSPRCCSPTARPTGLGSPPRPHGRSLRQTRSHS